MTDDDEHATTLAGTLAGKTRTLFAQTPEQMVDKGLPLDRAEMKAESTGAGWFAVLIGCVLLAVASSLALIIVYGGKDLTVVAAVVIGLFGVVGLAIALVGMSLVSRDASPAIAAAGDLVERVIRAWRRNGGGGA